MYETQHVVCEDCGSDSIYFGLDNACCRECGSTDLLDRAADLALFGNTFGDIDMESNLYEWDNLKMKLIHDLEPAMFSLQDCCRTEQQEIEYNRLITEIVNVHFQMDEIESKFDYREQEMLAKVLSSI